MAGFVARSKPHSLGVVLPGQPPSTALRIVKPANVLKHSGGGVTAVQELSWLRPNMVEVDERLQRSEMPLLVGGASGSPRIITEGVPQAAVIQPWLGNTESAPGARMTMLMGMMSMPATTEVPK